MPRKKKIAKSKLQNCKSAKKKKKIATKYDTCKKRKELKGNDV